MKQLIKIDKNGSKHWLMDVTCDRCGGQGGADQWKFTGWKCYKCNGKGTVVRTVIERTPEYQAILDAKRMKKAQAQAEAERKEREAEEAARKAEFEKAEAERKAREAAEAERKARSQYVGTEGEKITIEADLEAVIRYEVAGPFGQPETRRLYKFRDSDGNALAWHTSSGRYIELEGERVTVTATIKRHSEYRGEKQTELLRCKIEKLG